MCMWSVMKNIFNLIENFLGIINNKHYLITCAKYYSSNMNDAHTVYLANLVSLPTKVVWPTAFFLKKKMIFVQLLCWPMAGRLGSQLMRCV